MPAAHASPFPPQLVPSAIVLSSGHADDAPVHVSTISHDPRLPRQTVPLEAKPQVALQHADDEGSQTALARNLHVVGSQQVEVELAPGSQSLVEGGEEERAEKDQLDVASERDRGRKRRSHSPGSTIPFPHCWSDISVTDPGSARHDESTARLPRTEQTLPTVQGEKAASPDDETGDMMKAPPAEHVLALRVQHEVEEVQPSVQSWMAWQGKEEESGPGQR